ncbi:MAG: iron-sulfur cluster assembly scaffold protein [Desulfobacterales bacterium]
MLKTHSKRYIEMAFGHEKRKRIADADGHGKRTGDCGDTIEIFIRVKDGRIVQTFFDINGCANTAACANTVSKLSEDKTLEEAWEIDVDDIIAYLETLPPEHYHCAQLAAGAFFLALSDYSANQRGQWKKLYANKG